ncbi:hypothetical protein Nwi_0148 [Nitrobacter winogradskyi Nb-255]|uniref:Uncharacterized protein n=1 Tax=Nitrobacter winogradskyi (strain ATCC 25391 / DSM 10237 / CIP 104748 / NCIMB 11846 / Nb-255) TaxID=323098 RepID=Q3SWC5_NITWN|nr:hypothetical protein [Nitrobacter winogradskyi]ABA03416.1 hypothetical protein Nwi_0148 [Nitrobacter winogradskyi Nb-255]
METLREFITRRHKELDELEAPLRQQLAAIADEREELRRAALAAGPPPMRPANTVTQQADEGRRSRRTIPEKTIKDAVVEVLRAKGSGMTALEILAAINLKFGTEYPRTSLSPQLSRLKADGKINRDGIVWTLEKKLIDYVDQPFQRDIEEAFK